MRGKCVKSGSGVEPRTTSPIRISVKPLGGLVLATMLGACAGGGPLTHDTAPVAPEPVAEAPTAPQAPQRRAPGPMRIHAPEGAHAARPVTRASLGAEDDRFAFLDWFGAAAEPARAPSPAAELRKARAVTAKMERTETADDAPKMFSDDENRRLLAPRSTLPTSPGSGRGCSGPVSSPFRGRWPEGPEGVPGWRPRM